MAALVPGPVTLIGSSLGGFVAWHVAARQAEAEGAEGRATHPVERLVLLAPAFDFGKSPLGGMDAAGRPRCAIIDAGPDERRLFLEEAAGVARYKFRKNEALRKVQATEQNLLRLNRIGMQMLDSCAIFIQALALELVSRLRDSRCWGDRWF